MEKEKLYSLEEATEIIQTFLLNKLHKEKKISMKIKTPPMQNALAWFDPTDDGLYITNDFSRWTTELLYVLPLHENTHKVLYGLVENYENGYHNIAFRDFFEKYSGMRTYHDERLGWQFIQNVGEKYIEWLEKLKDVLNEIFKVIKNTDLPKKEQEQDSDQNGQNGEQDGQDGQEGEPRETEAQKMNKILRENSGQSGEQSDEQNDEKGNEKADEKGDQDSDQDGQEGEQSGEQNDEKGNGQNREQSGAEYEGQTQDVVVKGGKKKFKI